MSRITRSFPFLPIAILVALAGCGPGAMPASPGPLAEPSPNPMSVASPMPPAHPSPSPPAEPLPTAFNMPDDWDPMAFVDDSLDYGNQAFGGEGLLEISDHCVVLRMPTQATTLVWRAGEAAWNPADQSIVFWNPFDDPAAQVVLRDGMVIRVGGRGTRPEDDTQLPVERWLQRPSSSCPELTFNVHSIEIVTPSP